MKLAILCSGQGAQHPAMFRLTRAAAPALFEHAARLLGAPVDSWLAHADSAMLSDNRSAQILCTLQTLAAAAALGDAWPAECCVAGYSVGELAAWGVASLIEPPAVLRLAAARAQLMKTHSAFDGAMIAVRGLERSVVERLCDGRDAAIAIVNPADSYVIAGRRAALTDIATAARAAGASRIVALPVEVASHTRFLAGAAAAFSTLAATVVAVNSAVNSTVGPAVRPAVGHAVGHAVGPVLSPAVRPDVRPDLPRMRLFSGIDAAPVIDVAAGIDKLARQIEQPVRWDACLAACVEHGASAFLELGPGRALSDMAAATYPQLAARSLEDFRSIDGVRRWLRNVASDGGTSV